jgi:predicted transcriptional regulator
MKYGDRNEIIAQILEIFNRKRVTRTKRMSDTNLTFYSAKEYLLLLLENGLVDYKTKGQLAGIWQPRDLS